MQQDLSEGREPALQEPTVILPTVQQRPQPERTPSPQRPPQDRTGERTPAQQGPADRPAGQLRPGQSPARRTTAPGRTGRRRARAATPRSRRRPRRPARRPGGVRHEHNAAAARPVRAATSPPTGPATAPSSGTGRRSPAGRRPPARRPGRSCGCAAGTRRCRGGSAGSAGTCGRCWSVDLRAGVVGRGGDLRAALRRRGDRVQPLVSAAVRAAAGGVAAGAGGQPGVRAAVPVRRHGRVPAGVPRRCRA